VGHERVRSSHSGVAYSGWKPVSTYSRAPFSRKTFGYLGPGTSPSNRYRCEHIGGQNRPALVRTGDAVLALRPKIRRFISTRDGGNGRAPAAFLHRGVAVERPRVADAGLSVAALLHGAELR
jgi:hypothetical protein